MTRLGQKGDADEVLAHPFFADIDLKKLQMKELQAPFIPILPDIEQMKRNNKIINFKDLQETIIPKQKMDLVNKKNEEFDIFGDVDEISTA